TDAAAVTDASTTTDPFAVAQSTSHSEGKATALSSRNNHLTDIITGTSNIAGASLASASVHTPTITDLEVASVHLPPVLNEAQEAAQHKSQAPDVVERIQSMDLEMETPVPRSTNSEIAIGDERRHTCDMSQSMLLASNSAISTRVSLTESVIPPVPVIPKDYYGATALRPNNPSVDGIESRVSIGSAFGVKTTMETGAIQPIYADLRTESVHEVRTEHEHDSESEIPVSPPKVILSPGRPSTGPPSSLLARAAARASMGSELADMAREHNYPSQSVNLQHQYNSSGSDSQQESPKTGSLHPEHHLSSSLPPTTTQPSVQAYANSNNGGHMMPTGAAVISSTTRTAYTFNHSTSEVHVPPTTTHTTQYQHITDSSGVSIGRSNKYRPSPNGSISSMSTDYGGGRERDRRMSVSSNYDGQGNTSTDPTMIQVITQTMIGDYLWKYTRRPTVMASVISEKRHRRYFWVHPYTKTMYWSLNNPAAEGSREQRAKSALIVNVFQITDDNVHSGNSDLPNVSLLVQTSTRNLKLTAPTREKHDLWYQSLAYLLSRPSTPGGAGGAGALETPSDNQTWSEVQAARGVSSDTLLTIRNDKTVRKKGSFNRLHSIFGRSKEASPVSSPRRGSGSGSAHVGAASSGSAPGSGISTSSVGGGHQQHQIQQHPAQQQQQQQQHQQQQYSSTSSGGLPHSQPQHAPVSAGHGNANANVVGYPSHMASQGSHVVGGYGTMNGGPILSSSSSSPRSRLNEQQHEQSHYGTTVTDEDVDLEDDEDDDDDEDGVLPEHIRQCCDGKHDIGSLHHH
ncbi:hypothetical protein BG004_000696, partial [Podila humilis]